MPATRSTSRPAARAKTVRAARAEALPVAARKQPRQARSLATMDAVFEATIQVLLREGSQRLTTTRVAERAGVSVGTLYQYYPNKQALLHAVLLRHLARVADAVIAVAEAHHGATLEAMTSAVVHAFVDAKTARVDEAKALYAVVSELGALAVIQATEKRAVQALATMLASAADARFADVQLTAYMLTAAMIGPTRAMLEGGAPPKMLRALRQQLVSLCLGYLEREAG